MKSSFELRRKEWMIKEQQSIPKSVRFRKCLEVQMKSRRSCAEAKS